MKTRDHHILHYLILVIGLAVIFGLMYIFSFDKSMQTFLAINAAVYYSMWGIVHHHIEGRLNKLIVLEYVSFSIFICVLFLVLLNN